MNSIGPQDKIAKAGRGRIHQLSRRLLGGLEFLKGGTRRDPTLPPNRVETAFQIVEQYEQLSGEVYRQRAVAGGFREGEEILSDLATEILRTARPKKKESSAYVEFITLYRITWRKHLGLFFFLTSLFLATLLLGWNIGANEPDYAILVIGQGMMETIHDHKPWFESIKDSPIQAGLEIAWNNIRVSISCFILGALLGFGSLLLLGYNGLNFGTVLGYCAANHFHEPLMGFVLSHGPLELTIIIASAFAGVLIGRAFYVRPLSKMRERVREASREAACVCLGVTPWLILAAMFEAFVSPFPFFTNGQKILFGVVISVLFWVWTFGPIPKSSSEPGSAQ